MIMNIGIDFGSTYSTFSMCDPKTGQVEALTLVEGEPFSIPTVVSISKSGRVTCGKGAKEQIGRSTVRIFEAFKMLLTETDETVLAQRGYDSTYTPKEIAINYLRSVLMGITNRYDVELFEEICICIPEIWGQKLNTLDGRSVLLEIFETLKKEYDIPVGHVRAITEPEAASAFYAYNYEKETSKSFDGHLLLVDYGGGTLDITLTQIHSAGKGSMEIGYREGGGAGESHPDENGHCVIGSAGIAYMQEVVARAMRDAGMLQSDEIPDYKSPDFLSAVRDLESQLKTPDRIKEIEDTFGFYGYNYDDIEDILSEELSEFITLEYDGEEFPVYYQHLYLAYKHTIEPVINREIGLINEKVKEHIKSNPCEPKAGMNGNFKIALVGGFGSFYLVKKQIAQIYNLDSNVEMDMRTKNINASKRELAISLGAALIAANKVRLEKTSRYSIGLFTKAPGEREFKTHYGIKYHQSIEPGKPYFITDESGNKMLFGGLGGGLDVFAIGFSDDFEHGIKMKIKDEISKNLNRELEEDPYGIWHCGFSMNESDIVTFHLIPQSIRGMCTLGREHSIRLESYTKLFDLTAIEEV